MPSTDRLQVVKRNNSEIANSCQFQPGLLDLRACFSLAMVLITHDLAVAARVAERVVVMHAGRIVEEGTVAEVMRAPRSPYTLELLEAASLAG